MKLRNGKLSNPYLKYSKVSLEVVTNSFNKDQFQKIKDMFTYFDRLGQQYIRREDLPFALRALGYLVTTLEIREMASFLDPKKTQKINFEQFLTACYFVKDRTPHQDEIYGALKLFDRKRNGYVNVHDIRNVVTQIGDLVNQVEFETVFSELDVNQNGECALADLIELLTINN